MKTVVITGTSRGIGLATVKRFLWEGWFVIGTSTTGTNDIQSPNFICLRLDYLKPETITAVVHDIKALNKKVDVLVNNAGVAYEETTPTVDIKILRETLEVNLIGLADFTNQLLPLFNSPAHIVNVSSNAGTLVDFKPGQWVTPAYKISKTALNMYTRITGSQLKEKGILVSSLDPGWTQTDMGGEEAPRKPEEPAEEIYKLAVSQVETGLFWHKGKERNW